MMRPTATQDTGRPWNGTGGDHSVLAWLSWPFFMQAYAVGEHSSNAGGLLRWPIKLLLPVGFALLALQGLSEVIKRAAARFGIPYQTYMKQAAFRQALADLKAAEVAEQDGAAGVSGQRAMPRHRGRGSRT